MLLWVSLFVGLALILATGGLVLAMGRAERRARRKLYRSLGLAEVTVEFLMSRNRDVIAELNYVRHQGEAKIRHEALPHDRGAAAQHSGFRFSQAVGQPAVPSEEVRQPGAERLPPDGHTRH